MPIVITVEMDRFGDMLCVCDFIHSVIRRETGLIFEYWGTAEPTVQMRNPNTNRWRDAFSTWQDCDNIPRVALCHRCHSMLGLESRSAHFRGISSRRDWERLNEQPQDSHRCNFCDALAFSLQRSNTMLDYLGKMTNYVLSINPPQPADEYASVYPDFVWWYDPLNVRRAVFCPFCDSLWAVDDPQ